MHRTAEPGAAARERVAPGDEELITPAGLGVARAALRRAGLAPGMRFLDVAGGTGALAIPAANLGAEVLAVDVSLATIERLNLRARTEGLPNLIGRVMDGQRLALEDAAFDVTGSLFGVMMIPDLPSRLREMARVTRPGGRVVVVAFGAPSRVGFFALTVAAMRASIPGFTGPAMDPPPLPLQSCEPDRVRLELTAAGLRDVSVGTVTEALEFGSARQLWRCFVHSNPVGAAVAARFADAEVALVERTLEDMLRERSGGDGPAALTQEIHIGVGSR
ncbi:MAG TPA: methyltransferase domain-containing protein [Kofleriaceae bacterium]|nr:methyltransferase domain-containing protein [Kofleriaceae bacterium]